MTGTWRRCYHTQQLELPVFPTASGTDDRHPSHLPHVTSVTSVTSPVIRHPRAPRCWRVSHGSRPSRRREAVTVLFGCTARPECLCVCLRRMELCMCVFR